MESHYAKAIDENNNAIYLGSDELFLVLKHLDFLQLLTLWKISKCWKDLIFSNQRALFTNLDFSSYLHLATPTLIERLLKQFGRYLQRIDLRHATPTDDPDYERYLSNLIYQHCSLNQFKEIHIWGNVLQLSNPTCTDLRILTGTTYTLSSIIKAFPSIEHIELHNSVVEWRGPNNATVPSKCGHLKSLKINSCSVSELISLCDLSQLRVLHIKQPDESVTSLTAVIRAAPLLEELVLHTFGPIDTIAAAVALHCHHIRKCCIIGRNDGHGLNEALLSLGDTLEEASIYFGTEQPERDALSSIPKACFKLKSISLFGDLELPLFELIEPLASSVQKIVVNNMKVSSDIWNFLGKFKSLKTLKLFVPYYSQPELLEDLPLFLEHHPQIKTLCLDMYNYGGDFTKLFPIINSIQLEKLKLLNLDQLNPTKAEQLPNIFQSLKQLTIRNRRWIRSGSGTNDTANNNEWTIIYDLPDYDEDRVLSEYTPTAPSYDPIP